MINESNGHNSARIVGGGNQSREQKRKNGRPIKVGWATFWGVFPDLFAFTPLFSFLIFEAILGNVDFSSFPQPDSVEPTRGGASVLFGVTGTLYSLSHSLIIFGAVLGLVYIFSKRFPWEMLGWLLHIVIDIPTHSYTFYPASFLWPLSDLKVNGLSWANSRFMTVNYSAMAVVYLILWRIKKKRADLV